MEIFGCYRGHWNGIVWFSLLASVIFATTGFALSSQEELQLGPLASNRPLVLPGNSLLEVQCALHLLNILRNACGATRVHFTEKRQVNFVDDYVTDLSDGCITPLPVVSQACSRSRDPTSGIFSVEGKRYMPSEFVAARGRRKGPNGVDQNDYPPGFLASRGRRSDGQQHQRDRKEDGELSDLYVNGFIGTRG